MEEKQLVAWWPGSREESREEGGERPLQAAPIAIPSSCQISPDITPAIVRQRTEALKRVRGLGASQCVNQDPSALLDLSYVDEPVPSRGGVTFPASQAASCGHG